MRSLLSDVPAVVSVIPADVRLAADRELCRLYPGWFCVVFHRGYFDEGAALWRLVYTVQAAPNLEADKVAWVALRAAARLDGSLAWVPFNVL